jgi:hypothetical protein
MGWTCHTRGGKEIHKIIWLKSLKERTTSKTSHRWECDINMDFRDIVWECMDWILLAL